jgi:hypothetical protein
MTVADDYLAQIGAADFDAWEHEDAAQFVAGAKSGPRDRRNDAVREARLLSTAAQPVVQFIISLPVAGMPGVDLARDADLAASAAFNRRTVLSYQSAGLNGRFAERNLRLLDRVCALIGQWPEPDWSETVRRRVERLGEARRAGRERGKRLREAGRMPDPPSEPSVAWLLRHPGDHWFRHARPAITDAMLGAMIDDWIAEFAPSYATLAGEDWSAEEGKADLVADIALAEEVHSGWNQPVRAVVLDKRQGSVQIGSELPLRLVPTGDGPFNGTLIAVLPGEHWRTCGSLLADGSLLPADGTRRLAVPHSVSRA